ncbi:hypothetical protein [Horticoccus sp. 23ND18S-11]|uniref:hypothetical protein n=1 Tax=Horticoccus sp. 23ND18S-11 TaxID=3391832 RepID=UPI0039C8F390
MNNVLLLVRKAREGNDPCRRLGTDAMLIELVALHDEMLEQLRTDQCGEVADPAFFADMIRQHEEAAASLRHMLENPESGNATGDALWSQSPRTMSAS